MKTLVYQTRGGKNQSAKSRIKIQKKLYCQQQLTVERGVEFDRGNAFYRYESGLSRDLGVLACLVHQNIIGKKVRALDALAGCGIRGLRYLTQGNVEFVLCNDNNADIQGVLSSNLQRCGGPSWSWNISKCEINKLFMKLQTQQSEYFDLVDIDSQGADSLFFGNALGCVKFGGMLYVTSTDGFSSSGRRPERALANYGTWTHSMPFGNELGLRMLIGCIVREGGMRGIKVRPLFSLYSPHGPVFRSMLRIEQGADWLHENYAFVGHCNSDGSSEIVHWENLSKAWCRKRSEENGDPVPMKLCGPLWTGPLHDTRFLELMETERKNLGWDGSPFNKHAIQDNSNKKNLKSLNKLLGVMLDESDPLLPPWYVNVDRVAQLAGLPHVPTSNSLIQHLKHNGFIATKTHIQDKGIKSNARMEDIIKVAREIMI